MLGWQCLYGDTQGAANVAFAGSPSFTIEGAGLARDTVRIDFGADYMFNDRAKTGLGYRGTLTGSSIRGDFRLAF